MAADVRRSQTTSSSECHETPTGKRKISTSDDNIDIVQKRSKIVADPVKKRKLDVESSNTRPVKIMKTENFKSYKMCPGELSQRMVSWSTHFVEAY